MKDIVERLRVIACVKDTGVACGKCLTCQAADEIERLRDENKRLDESLSFSSGSAIHQASERNKLLNLIIAWADAEDVVENDFQFRDWDALDRGDDERELEAARAALRKAVER